MNENRLRPLSEKIIIKYFLKDNQESAEKIRRFDTYEEFGEWICRTFDKIKIIDIIDISDK